MSDAEGAPPSGGTTGVGSGGVKTEGAGAPGNDAENPDFINLKVKSAQNAEIWFRVKKTTPLNKLMKAYCERNHQDPNSVVFLFDGERIRADQTPSDLDMEDKDEIDAMLHQTGGRRSKAGGCIHQL
ncbi:small ubiquitin-related modifier [Pycnococcus provasolii]|mmetsp:Transcript_11985/g.30169  ORF Transcript_11985/g.30169 Transcript_11985/m.30169 type:complete len:127 (+) Transcript_11985:65-445(+)